MGIGSAAFMIVLGILGAANLIIARKPDAKELIGKIAPYQGWIGAIAALWGIWIIIWSVLGIGLLATMPVTWISYLAIGAVLAILGLLLGIGIIKSFVKQPQAVEKMDAVVAKFSPYQGTLGLISIFLGIWGVIVNFLPF